MPTKLSIHTQMTISPQLVMTGRLLQVPASELEQFIHRELENNPALELSNRPDFMKQKRLLACPASHSYLPSANRSKAGAIQTVSFEEMIENIAQPQSPMEKLIEQLSLVADKKDRAVAVHLLHRLDHRGFLVIPLEPLAAELGISDEMIRRAINVLHQLEPPGIGARDVRECFLLQCTHLEAEGIECETVRRILTVAWDEFLNQQWDRVARKIKESKGVVEEAGQFMRQNFYPHPLSMMETSIESNATLQYADLIVVRDKHIEPSIYLLEIPGEADLELTTAGTFQKMLGSASQAEGGLSAQEKTWIRIHIDRAAIVINALRQRWETLRRIGEYLIEFQRDFLERGPLYLKPLTRAAVARDLDLHESTISRAVRDKVIQLPDGRFMALSDFFDSSLCAKEAIRRLLRNAPKPLCDREIAEGLQAKGMSVSRRTVTKYRREIHIDSSRPQSLGV